MKAKETYYKAVIKDENKFKSIACLLIEKKFKYKNSEFIYNTGEISKVIDVETGQEIRYQSFSEAQK